MIVDILALCQTLVSSHLTNVVLDFSLQNLEANRNLFISLLYEFKNITLTLYMNV